MGVGVSRLINIVEGSYQAGVDGNEPTSTQVKQVWAQVSLVSQSRAFDSNKGSYKNAIQFLIRVDSSLSFTQSTMIEYDNRRFSLQSIEKGVIIQQDGKYNNQFRLKDNGDYWRIISTSEDIS